MQIKINTDTKTLEIEGVVNIRELLNTLKELGLNKEEWSIDVSKQIQYVPYYPQPYYIEPYIPYISPGPWITCLDIHDLPKQTVTCTSNSCACKE